MSVSDKRVFAAHVTDMAELAADQLGGLTDQDWANAEALCRERGWTDIADWINKQY